MICGALGIYAPLWLAEEWDNVGLIVGDRATPVSRIMTCLTLTPDVVAEAVGSRAELIVSHHPMPFRPVSKVTADQTVGRLLLQLAAAGIAVYSPHTALDSAANGINQMWADQLSLSDVQPLRPSQRDPTVGSGRFGRTEKTSVQQLMNRCGPLIGKAIPRLIGDPKKDAGKVAIACGSGGSFVDVAVRRGCQTLVTGEATFHQCLDARTAGVSLVLLGHYQSERFAVERAAEWLGTKFPELTVWASEVECDPIYETS